MRVVVLTGASGSGKTTIAETIASRYAAHVEVHHFDRIGVPSPEQMIADHGSPEAWQRAMTHDWMARLARQTPTRRGILLEGQMRLSFIAEAAAAAGISDYVPILLDCDDATRVQRLVSARAQSHLANPTMMHWAQFLRDEADRIGCLVLDTSRAPLDHCVERVWEHLQQGH